MNVLYLSALNNIQTSIKGVGVERKCLYVWVTFFYTRSRKGVNQADHSFLKIRMH
jgi:hypothetical protein